MKMLQAPNEFKIPFSGGWPIAEASYLIQNKRPRIFHRGYGWFSYKTSGPKAWTEVELPDPPREPDKRFQKDAYARWLPQWEDYAATHGVVAAAQGSLCCEMTRESYVINLVTRAWRCPPPELMTQVKELTGVDPSGHESVLSSLFTRAYSLDLLGFAARLMRSKEVDFDTWNRTVNQSLSNWIKEQFGEEAQIAVKALMNWRPTEEVVADQRAFLDNYRKQRDEALATLKAVKRA